MGYSLSLVINLKDWLDGKTTSFFRGKSLKYPLSALVALTVTYQNQFRRSYCKSRVRLGFLPFFCSLHHFFISCSTISFETLAAALIIGLFALFIVVYTICLQCCWSNRRCPWFLDKEDSSAKDKYTFCPCVQGVHSPDSWQSVSDDLEQVFWLRLFSKTFFAP